MADYAIWLIETKESHSKHRDFWERRATLFESVKSLLTEEERILYEEVRSNSPGVGRAHRLAIQKLKKELEKVVTNQRQVKPAQQDMTDAADWDKKVDAMSEKELLEGYWDQEAVAL